MDLGTDSREKRRGFSSGNWRGFHVDFLSPFLPVPKNPCQIHAIQNPLKAVTVLSNRVLVETNFEASKTLFQKGISEPQEWP